MLEMQTCYLSELGGRERNEDACGYWTSASSACWVVSDGAGGHGSGDVASRLAVSTILRSFATSPSVTPDTAASLLNAAHEAIIHQKHSGQTTDDMHATAAVLLIEPHAAVALWGHVGDTRVYLFRHGSLTYQTRDHSLVQELINAGYGSTDMIRSHPKRSLLTSALGSSNELALSVASEPMSLRDGDIFLLCTDGWWEYVEEHEMENLLGTTPSAQAWLDGMRDMIVSRATDTNDNYTAMCVVIVDPRDSDETTVILPGRVDPSP